MGDAHRQSGNVTVPEAARLTNVAERTIRNWITAGRLTCVKTKSGYRVAPLEVLELADRRGAGGRLPKTRT